MRTTLIAPYFLVGSLAAVPCQALEYAGTCRGASATITAIEGIDTSRARVTAQHSRPDAISYCYYSLGRAEGKSSPKPSAISACADGFLREAAASGPITAEANCKTGKLSTAGGKWSNAYSFPVTPMCGDDNNQAIAIFRVMCPSFENVEKLN